ncbi:MAG: hypothetical protein WAU89_19060 [Candidatus Acidiferrales bacterium]
MSKDLLIEISWVIVALMLIVSAVVMGEIATRHTPNWVPMRLLVSLKTGTIHTPEFAVDRDGIYEIVIDLENKFGIEKMQCLLGTANRDSPQCVGVPDLIDISWTLFEGNEAITTGNSQNSPGLIQSDTLTRYLGTVTCQRGHRYSFTLEIKKDASDLDVAHPTIVVEVPYGDFKDYGVGVAIRKAEAWSLGILGIVLFVGLFIFHIRRRNTVC